MSHMKIGHAPKQPEVMEYEVAQTRGSEEEWQVEAIDDDGRIFIAAFGGPDSQQRATEYAAWKNAQNQPSTGRLKG